MTLAQVQFYENPWNYPDYKHTLEHVTANIDCTPKGTSLKGGSLHLSGSYATYSKYNYMVIRRGTQVSYAWVDNVTERTANSVQIDYTVDAFRTYRNRLTLGRQFVTRQPEHTALFDELLASSTPTDTQDVHVQRFGTTDKRVFVVQVRRLATDEVFSRTPVQPTPYRFYFAEYDTNNWLNSAPIQNLLNALQSGAETENIVTIYSLPYMDISELATHSLHVSFAGRDSITIEGFKMLHEITTSSVQTYLRRSIEVHVPYNTDEMQQVNYDFKILIPGAGIMQVSREALERGNLRIRQDVDLFSGGSNFMLTCGANSHPTGQSVRGSSVSSIPILSDPFDTYLSQNQNSLSTSMIGDVATLATGLGMATTGNPLGAGTAMSGARGLFNRQTNLADARSALPSNPPSMLGTALANDFNNRFFTIVTYTEADNREDVHESFGYPIGMVKPLAIPTQGFIQTQNCNVGSDGTVPRWAVEEINTIFDNGLRVRG